MPLNRMLIIKLGKICHAELNIEGNCIYSADMLQKFKKRHGIIYLKISGDKASADHADKREWITRDISL